MRVLKLTFVSVMLIFMTACGSKQTREGQPDFENIYNHAFYSHVSYLDLSQLEHWTTEHGHTLVHTNKASSDEVQYILFRPKDKEYDVIAIRGTASLDDALVDMKFKLKYMDSYGINIHTGFGEAAEKVFNELKPFLDKERPIHTTGHSLGGAEALALGMLLVNNGYQLDAIYTYGQPKITDWNGRDKFKNLPLTRVVTKSDVVPLVPPVSLDLKAEAGLYWHIGDEIVIYEGATYSELGFTDIVARQVVDFIPNTFTQRQLSAHYMDTYMNYLTPKLMHAQRVEYEF